MSPGNAGHKEVLARLGDLASQLDHHKLHYKLHELRDLFFAAGGLLVKSKGSQPDSELLHLVVSLPIRIYTEASINIAQDVWTWIADSRGELESRLIAEIVEAWSATVEKGQGLFSRALEYVYPSSSSELRAPS